MGIGRLIGGGLASIAISMGGMAAADEFVTIGTGGVTGVYYPTGGAICRMVNRDRRDHGVHCSVESTGGSFDNLEALRRGELQFGMTQEDWEVHAYRATARFSDRAPFEDLRSVFAVHSEPFTILARADSGIETVLDLKDKRVNIGNPGSGQRGTMEVLMQALGWTMEDFARVTELKAVEQSVALCDDQIDAMVYIVGHPSGSIQEATIACDAVLVEVSGPAVEALVARDPFYTAMEIPGGLYFGNPDPVPTFGVTAMLVTTAEVSDDTVHTLTAAVFDNFDDFRALHPALRDLDPTVMARPGLAAPLHPGALRYFREAGLIE